MSRADELLQEYLALSHAMQSGVAAEMAISERGAATEPKHLRVGVNSALVSNGALVKLLVEKGVITEEEFALALRDRMKAEVEAYEERLSKHHGARIRLG